MYSAVEVIIAIISKKQNSEKLLSLDTPLVDIICTAWIDL